MNMKVPSSKKLWVFLFSAVAFAANGFAGKPMDEESMNQLLILAGAYLLGQGIADHGWQGALNGAKRAVKEGHDVAELVGSLTRKRAVEVNEPEAEEEEVDEKAPPQRKGKRKVLTEG